MMAVLCMYIVYLDARGDIITDDRQHYKDAYILPSLILSADVTRYARDNDSVWGPCGKLVFSAHYIYRR